MPKNARIRSVSTSFYKGKYSEVLSEIGSDPLDVHIDDFATLTAFQVGALVFLGQLSEAKLIFALAQKNKFQETFFAARCSFYLGVGCVRRSLYNEACNYFAKNLLYFKRNQKLFGAEDQFYIYQGSAFYGFFKGQFAKALRFAQLAYGASFSSHFKYGQVLSLDLLGHSLCQIGKIRRGLFELSRAHNIALKIGNGGIETALRVSIEKYRALFGISLETTIDDLENAIRNLEPQDTYSQAELYLELVRHLILQGQGTLAQQKLEVVGEIIYRHQNKRQTAIFNHRYSHLLLLRGERLAARALLSSLKSNLNDRVDRVSLGQVAGLEKKINKDFPENSISNPNLSALSFNFIDQRIRQREEDGYSIGSIDKGEDPLGDILDQVHAEGSLAYSTIKSKKLFGLLPRALGIPRGSTAIYLGPSRSEIIIFDGADVQVVDRDITQPMKKLLALISEGRFQSKEFLIENIWKYKYNPKIHDNVLYALIGKLRKLLGRYSSWIEWSNEGYGLSPHVKLLNSTPSAVKSLGGVSLNPIMSSTPIKQNPNYFSELSLRQIKALKNIKTMNAINVRDYAKIHKICTMTAYRDLAGLQQKGFLIRIGKGRATTYVYDENKI